MTWLLFKLVRYEALYFVLSASLVSLITSLAGGNMSALATTVDCWPSIIRFASAASRVGDDVFSEAFANIYQIF